MSTINTSSALSSVFGEPKGSTSSSGIAPKSFREFLDSVQNTSSELSGGVLRALDAYGERWGKTQEGIQKQISKLPKGARELIELQVSVNRLHFESQLIAKVGETATHTIRRVQQMGGGS